jgi:hypothetical protein
MREFFRRRNLRGVFYFLPLTIALQHCGIGARFFGVLARDPEKRGFQAFGLDLRHFTIEKIERDDI